MSNEKFKVKFGLAVGDTAATIDGTTGDIVTNGDIQLNGNDIKSSTGLAAITMDDVNVDINGELTISGNRIRSSGGSPFPLGDIAVQLNGTNVEVVGDLTVSGTNINTGATDTRIQIDRTTATTNIARNALVLQTTTTGTPALGMGTSLGFNGQIPDGTYKEAGFIIVDSTDVTTGSEDFRMRFGLMQDGQTYADKLILDSYGSLIVGGGQRTNRTLTGGGKTLNTQGNVLVQKVGGMGSQSPTAAFFDNSSGSRRGTVIVREYGQSTGVSPQTGTGTAGQSGLILESSRGTASSPLANSGNNLTVATIGSGGYDGNRWISENGLGQPNVIAFQNSEPYQSETTAFTGYITGNTLTVTAVSSGTLAPGQLLTAEAWTSTGSTITGTTLTIGTLTSGTIQPNQPITGTGVLPNTYIVSGSGSTWTVSQNHVNPVTATNINGSLTISTVITTFGANTSGGVGTYTVSINASAGSAGSPLSFTSVGTSAGGSRFVFVSTPTGIKLSTAARQSWFVNAQAAPFTETINGVSINNGPSTNYIFGNIDGSSNQQFVSTDGTKIYQGRGSQNFQWNGGSINQVGVTNEDQAQFQGYITGNTLTVTSVSSGTISLGALINASGIAQGTFISAFGTGTGNTGDYTIISNYATGGQTIGSSGSPVNMVTTPDNNTLKGTASINLTTSRKSPIYGRLSPLRENDNLTTINFSGANGNSPSASTTLAAQMRATALENFTPSASGTKFTIATNNVGTQTTADRLALDSTQARISTATKNWNFNENGTTSFPSYTFPYADGTSGQWLITDGSGNLSWSNTLSSLTLSSLTINGNYNTIQPLQYEANLNPSNSNSGATVGIQTNYRNTSGGSLVVPQTNWSLGGFRFNSYDDTAGTYVLGGSVLNQASENWSSGVNGSRLVFTTVPQGQPWTNNILSLFLQPEGNSYTSSQHSFNRLDGAQIMGVQSNGQIFFNDPGAAIQGNGVSITPLSVGGRQSLSLNSASTNGSAFSTLNFGNFRYDNTNYSPTQSGDVLGEYKFNGNSNSGGSPGVPGGPGGNITVSATENWTNTANGTTVNFFAIKAGTLNSYNVFRADPTAASFTSDSFTFATANASPTNLATINQTAATFTVPVSFPVYTAAAANAITGSVGMQICISNSAGGSNPNGMMAFWDTTNSRWSYIHDNSAV